MVLAEKIHSSMFTSHACLTQSYSFTANSFLAACNTWSVQPVESCMAALYSYECAGMCAKPSQLPQDRQHISQLKLTTTHDSWFQ